MYNMRKQLQISYQIHRVRSFAMALPTATQRRLFTRPGKKAFGHLLRGFAHKGLQAHGQRLGTRRQISLY